MVAQAITERENEDIKKSGCTHPTTNEDGPMMRTLKDENKRLERELNRKEKALAEAAALLVLQKKFQALLGGEVV